MCADAVDPTLDQDDREVALGCGIPNVAEIRQIDKCLGTPPSRPTLIASDPLSHAQVVNHLASANRSKPFMKQYVVQMQRVRDELINVGKVDDANMPSDFLTKWISGRKLKQSIRYATNSDAFVPRSQA